MRAGVVTTSWKERVHVGIQKSSLLTTGSGIGDDLGGRAGHGDGAHGRG